MKALNLLFLTSVFLLLLVAMPRADQPVPKGADKKGPPSPPATGPQVPADDANDLRPLPWPSQLPKKGGSTSQKKDSRSDSRSARPVEPPSEEQPLTPPTPVSPQDKTREILARLAQNLEAAEERLRQQDPGEQTRKLQEQIIKDLDELLKPPPPSKKEKKQQNNSQKQQNNQSSQNNQQKNEGNGSGAGNSSGGGGSAGSSGGSSSSSAGGSNSRSSGSPRGENIRSSSGGSTTKNSKGSAGSASTQKTETAGPSLTDSTQNQKEQKPDTSSTHGKNSVSGTQTGKTSGGSGGGQADQQKKGPLETGQLPKGQPLPKGSNLADVLRTEQDIWGHLPKTKRLEMDVYQRDRLPPQYEKLLRQYYRAIAERRRQKGD